MIRERSNNGPASRLHHQHAAPPACGIVALRAIRNDIHRFNGIKHALGSRVSNRTLSNLLSELTALGLIHKEPIGRYAHYCFTAKGAGIMRILDDTCDWAARFSGLPHA